MRVLFTIRSTLLSALDPFRSEWDLKFDSDRTATQWLQVQQLRLFRMNDLDNNHIGGILKLEIEVVKLRYVGSVDPQIILLSDPLAKTLALHRFSTDVDRHLRQQLFSEIEVFKGVLPALLVR